ncbi:MAG: hypothetical protein WAR37_03990 [Candidatus Microsaccharimonas sp.]
MNITVINKLGNREDYVSGQDAASKHEIFDSISQVYTNDDIDSIVVKYDDIEASTVDGGHITEPGDTVTLSTLEELRIELHGRYTG